MIEGNLIPYSRKAATSLKERQTFTFPSSMCNNRRFANADSPPACLKPIRRNRLRKVEISKVQFHKIRNSAVQHCLMWQQQRKARTSLNLNLSRPFCKHTIFFYYNIDRKLTKSVCSDTTEETIPKLKTRVLLAWQSGPPYNC